MEKNGLDLEKYSLLIVKKGLNLQRGEELVISSPVEAVSLVRAVSKTAYLQGAKKVTVFYTDNILLKDRFTFENESTLTDVENWYVSAKNYIVEKKACYLGIISDDPSVFDGVNPKLIAERQKALTKACPKYRDSLDSNRTRWCLVAYPNIAWAKLVFPESDNAVEELGKRISQTLWLDRADYLERWDRHSDSLSSRSEILNKSKIVSFHYSSSNGTDFTVGMPKGYIFTGAREKGSADGVYFIANMPTQEVFSSPDYRTVNGKIVSTMPLVRNGVIIDGFYFVFKDGVVVDFGAKRGYETLKEILDADDGMKRLGEIALVGYDSPIRNTGVLFYETLFDENASCHFALGKSFSSCYTGGTDMTKEELLKVGLNDSVNHVDFMVGAKDLSITALCEDGSTLPVFENGDWLF